MADEPIDIVTEDGEPTGEQCLKSYAHKNGLWHFSVHIWFYTLKGEILLQKRALNKIVFPGLWDVSVAGHIAAGESALSSAIREISEEIGLQLNTSQLQGIGNWKESQIHSNGIIDNEWHQMYISILDQPLNKLVLQKEEVADVKLIYLDEFKNQLQNISLYNIVPHSKTYYFNIMTHIENALLTI
jgi:isopentenyldiphosphate isomerase